MKRLLRYAGRLLALAAICILGLLSPVIYVETMCRGSATAGPHEALIASEFHRPETRTLMTYPEWHIVHAYDDYARVIATGDPHDYGYLRAVDGFWSSLCSLTERVSDLGEVDGATKQMVYVIGVSFTAELLLKGAYEETIGRLFAALRGPDQAPLDFLSAEQAASYAAFLQQTPWYKWRFREDRDALREQASSATRDRERLFALGIEYGVKATYAEVIAAAVARVGQDQLTLRMVVRGVDAEDLARQAGVTVLAENAAGILIEAPRYRELTNLLLRWAQAGADFVEIAGNDDIMFTALSAASEAPGAIYSRPRQGSEDYRHLIVVKVSNLADNLRSLGANGLTLEHIHDY
ncbi:MAG: hypothetical protein AAF367_05520 [Pseudomonadota bacterium]